MIKTLTLISTVMLGCLMLQPDLLLEYIGLVFAMMFVASMMIIVKKLRKVIKNENIMSTVSMSAFIVAFVVLMAAIPPEHQTASTSQIAAAVAVLIAVAILPLVRYITIRIMAKRGYAIPLHTSMMEIGGNDNGPE